MSDPERVSKHNAILTLALCWCIRTAEALSERKPLKLKKHERLEKSLFRYGFDHLRHIFLHIESLLEEFIDVLKLLSGESSNELVRTLGLKSICHENPYTKGFQAFVLYCA